MPVAHIGFCNVRAGTEYRSHSVPPKEFFLSKLSSFFGLVVVSAILFACAELNHKARPSVQVVTTADLRERLNNFKNKPLVVNFWATWCDPCTTEIPDLVKFYQSIDMSKLKMVGVSADFFVVGDSAKIVAKVQDFLLQKKVTYPNFIFRGPVDSLTGLFNLSGVLPETIVYDSSGREIFRHQDLITLSELRKAIAGL